MVNNALISSKKRIINFINNFDLIYIISYATILLPNARSIFKYMPFKEGLFFIIYLFLFIFIVYGIKSDKGIFIRNLISRPSVIISFILFFILITYFLYPLADGLKYQLRGSDQDDCVIMGVNSLSKLMHPYSQKTYMGSECSPGMGMFFLYFPFVLSGFYPLGAIVSSTLSVFAIGLYFKDKKIIVSFISFIVFSIFWFELLIVGSDLILFGSFLIIVCYGLIGAIKNKDNLFIIFYAIITGLLSSSRINFLILLPIFTIFILTKWKKGAISFLIIACVVAIIPSGIVYSINPNQFMPLHLLGKSNLILKNGFKEIAIIFSLINTLIGLQLVRNNIENLPSAILISLFPGLFMLSLGDFIFFRSLNPATWEGANYLMPIFPLSASIVSNKINNN